ncbi:hypothetical protein PoB_002416800 [Plakobranchus ocellatus]|uniref:Uncharacterized protein n=1 Tax=Plakobranchus ocellatus TaxID=259542 RepID=A0AAV3ZT48_9GAST|nr:hypothetical protein PoB_002416800 [Plakobranchus ocellatus]
MCTQDVQLSIQERQFFKTSECAHKRSNSQHGIGNLGRLPNVHTRCSTHHTGKAIWQDFRLCTPEVQLSTRDRCVGKTSESAHKMSNSQHGIGNLERHPNVHKRGPTQHGIDICKDFRICTQEVQLSTRDRQFGRTSECAQEVQLSTPFGRVGKTSECALKMSNSPHGVGNLTRLSNVHTAVRISTRDRNLERLPNVHTRCPTLHTG